MKSYIFIFICGILSTSLRAQDVVNYKFVVENKIITDSLTGFYSGIEYEYSYKRIYQKSNVFEERGLFSSYSDFFKIKKGCWYHKSGKTWRLFYSPRKTINPKIQIAERWCILHMVDSTKLNGIDCIIYRSESIGVQSGGELKYWFSPQKGIIKIETDEVTLIREDIKVE
jgi:hypothetical protein